MGNLCGSSAMSTEEKVFLLSQTPLFTLDEGTLQKLAQQFQVGEHKKGEIIVKERTPGSKFFVIGRGEVEVTAEDVTMTKVHLCVKKRGDFFADQALFEDQYQEAATVTALCPVMVLSLDKAGLTRFVTATSENMRDALTSIMGQGMMAKLTKIPFLQGVTEWKLQLLASLFQYETIPRATIIFREGDIGQKLYVVSQGRVRISASGDTGKDTEIAVLGPGSYFGEIALMVNMPRTASVTAVEDCLLLSLQKAEFSNFLHVVPELTAQFELVAKQRVAEQFKAFKVPFFTGIPDALYRELAELCIYEEYQADTVVFEEGDAGNVFYIVVFGKVSVLKNTDEGHQVLVNTLGSGRYFGEVALLRDAPRAFTVQTNTRCVFLGIERGDFERFFAAHPESFSDFELKLLGKEVSIDAVLRHDVARQSFEEHLKKEFASENMDFWKDVTEFQAVAAQEDQLRKAKEMAQAILNNYVFPEAKQCVNISSEQRDAIIIAVRNNKVTPNVFDAAKDEVKELMKRDPFKRFKNTDRFEQLLKEVGAYPGQFYKEAESQTLRPMRSKSVFSNAGMTPGSPPGMMVASSAPVSPELDGQPPRMSRGASISRPRGSVLLQSGSFKELLPAAGIPESSSGDVQLESVQPVIAQSDLDAFAMAENS